MHRKTTILPIVAILLGLPFGFFSCRAHDSGGTEQLREAEQFYDSGTSSNHASHYEESTFFLKQAENTLLQIDPSDLKPENKAKRNRLLGLTWFHLGNTSESEMLYDLAQDYYKKSIPMLDADLDATYLACAYRDIARTYGIIGGDLDSARAYFQIAAEIADSIGNNMLSQDIAAYYYQYCEPENRSGLMQACRSLAEDYGVRTRYAEIIELYLADGQTDSAAYYLEFLQPKDSAYAYWFEQSYAYFRSKIQLQQGATEEAYSGLLNLYDRKIEELQRDAGARTYALALHYDVEREKQRTEEAQRERQWQQTVSVILVLLLALVVTLMVVLWRYWQHRRHEQAMQIRALHDKYTLQLELALERLQQKVKLTREIELQRMKGNEVEFPKWLQTYRDEQLMMNKESLDQLVARIDNSLDGAISRLRTEYPDLTESDMQFVILAVIGASDDDMSILLNVQKQTIYHRRQIVRRHINPAIDNIDNWLRAYALKISLK
ncbi:MAG: hypothetical protein IJ548_01025 [Paludibacteraceae bacterium]|nr:hypothetical protein [Paludibacteraceae bacterium]MBQ9296415.1 hypothetical protein [Paludibacteraceae bacterium]